MKAIGGLSTVVRYCPNCDSEQTVNYWAHSEAPSVKRYQCDDCSTQVPDFKRMDVSPREYVSTMSGVLNQSTAEYIFNFGHKVCRTEDGFAPLFRLLE